MSLRGCPPPDGFPLLERQPVFPGDHAGYVSPAGDVRFTLDPSPFFRAPNPGIYCCTDTCPPPAGKAVEVSVAATRRERVPGARGRRPVPVRYVDAWEPLGPSASPGERLAPDAFLDFFTAPLQGDPEVAGRAGLAAALFTLSAPPAEGPFGGMNAGVFGRSAAWQIFRLLTQVIPAELTRTTSRFFYRMPGREQFVAVPGSGEVSLGFHNPVRTAVHLPLAFPGIASPGGVRARIAECSPETAPAVQATILDALLRTPRIPEALSRAVTEGVYEINAELQALRVLPCGIDIDALIPRVGASLARLHAEAEVTREAVRSAVRLFTEGLHDAVRASPKTCRLCDVYRIGSRAWKLYRGLEDRFGTDVLISADELFADPLLAGPPARRALADLRYAGYVIAPAGGRFVVLELSGAYKNGF